MKLSFVDFESLIVFLIFLTKSVISIDDQNLKESFQNFTNQFTRLYRRESEEKRHFEAFKNNFEYIQTHNELYNKGQKSFRLGLTDMADLNSERYLRQYVRLTKSERDKFPKEGTAGRNLDPELRATLADSLDWRSEGFVTLSDNQGSCGSCYAMSIVQSIEGQIFKRTGKVVPLSVQHVVDCSIAANNHGCSGGSLRNAFNYLEQCGGLMRQQDYPYAGKQGKCKFVRELAVVNVTSWSILPKNDEEAIKVAVASIGPIAVSINASPKTFQLYKEGIYDDDSCSDEVNHAMLLVGYSPDYWILKNWWGKNWGEDGYMKIRRGKNVCGIAKYAAYAIV